MKDSLFRIVVFRWGSKIQRLVSLTAELIGHRREIKKLTFLAQPQFVLFNPLVFCPSGRAPFHAFGFSVFFLGSSRTEAVILMFQLIR